MIMTETATFTELSGPSLIGEGVSTGPSRPPFRRRRYVLDKRRQYRTAALTSGLAILLLVEVNVAFSILRTSQTIVLTAAAPELGPILDAQDTRVGTMLIVISIVFVVGIFVLTIAETHRTAGAVYAVKQRLMRLRDGDYRVTLNLRPRDNLRDLMEPFNDVVASLRDRALADAAELERLADEAGDGTPLGATLRELAQQKRHLAS
jgi:methyl-accepting chemotaxis protein